MFTLYNSNKQLKPIKIWLNNIEEIESECLQQALNLSNLPFVHHWVALMPDTHAGYGMPIGGVIATKDVIIPNAVGVDIGCGMAVVETNLRRELLSEDILLKLVGNIMRNIPTGFEHHKNKQESKVLDDFINNNKHKGQPQELVKEIDRGYYQLGTLGSGNHFIELQVDEDDRVFVMLHSGSRNFGLKVAKHFNNLAKAINEKMGSKIPREFDLAYLTIESKEGQDYIKWMNLALDFAQENRHLMLTKVKDEIGKLFPQVIYSNEVNAHHNYAAFEEHFGEQVWVHRKGAISAQKDELGIIPGAMGSFSYLVTGLGNPESFYSCSHGAGRKMSRKKAIKEIPVEATINDLKELGVVLGKRKKQDISEESRFAYKDIEDVINKELDLITPLKKLRTIAVIKG